MKNLVIFLTLLLFSDCVFSQQSDNEHAMEIQVNGRHFITIPKESSNNYTVSIPLQKGRHEIRWVFKPETNQSGPNPEASTTIETVNPSEQGQTYTTDRIEVVNRVIALAENERDSIRVDIYDNGIVDNDTISVYSNNETLVADRKVSSVPISFYIGMKEGQQTKRIRMEAKNLGLIPPNTTVMIITTRQNKYLINMTSDMLKSAAVDFVLKKDQKE